MNYLQNLLSKKYSISKNKDITIIKILKTITNINQIPKNINKNILILDQNISPQTIIITSINNIDYSITYNNTTIIITKRDNNNQLKLIIDKINYTYELINNQSTYNKQSKTEDKKTSIPLLISLIDSISKIENISDYINIELITKILNITLSKDYYPVIKNETITLSWNKRYGNEDITKKAKAELTIILNETQEIIGKISFNTIYDPQISKTGNVSYYINEQHQNNHYATIALKLLKELLKQHQDKNKLSLYISTEEKNTISQKVAISNGGELIYEGEVPNSDNLTKYSGITKIKMYKIQL